MEIASLRAGKKPYVIYLLLYGWAPVLLGYGAFMYPENRASLLFAMLIMIAIPSWLILSLWRYRFYLYEGHISRRRFFEKSVRVALADIVDWKIESGLAYDGAVSVANARPLRRLVVLYRDGGVQRYLDISLTHFPPDAVRNFMAKLRSVRLGLREL